jgi:hypothetical protein
VSRRPGVGAHPHHHKRHGEITRRLEWLTSGLSAEYRDRAVRQAAWAIADHLRCCHGVRNVGRRALIPDMASVHGYLHREGT